MERTNKYIDENAIQNTLDGISYFTRNVDGNLKNDSLLQQNFGVIRELEEAENASDAGKPDQLNSLMKKFAVSEDLLLPKILLFFHNAQKGQLNYRKLHNANLPQAESLTRLFIPLWTDITDFNFDPETVGTPLPQNWFNGKKNNQMSQWDILKEMGNRVYTPLKKGHKSQLTEPREYSEEEYRFLTRYFGWRVEEENIELKTKGPRFIDLPTISAFGLITNFPYEMIMKDMNQLKNIGTLGGKLDEEGKHALRGFDIFCKQTITALCDSESSIHSEAIRMFLRFENTGIAPGLVPAIFEFYAAINELYGKGISAIQMIRDFNQLAREYKELSNTLYADLYHRISIDMKQSLEDNVGSRYLSLHEVMDLVRPDEMVFEEKIETQLLLSSIHSKQMDAEEITISNPRINWLAKPIHSIAIKPNQQNNIVVVDIHMQKDTSNLRNVHGRVFEGNSIKTLSYAIDCSNDQDPIVYYVVDENISPKEKAILDQELLKLVNSLLPERLPPKASPVKTDPITSVLNDERPAQNKPIYSSRLTPQGKRRVPSGKITHSRSVSDEYLTAEIEEKRNHLVTRIATTDESINIPPHILERIQEKIEAFNQSDGKLGNFRRLRHVEENNEILYRLRVGNYRVICRKTENPNEVVVVDVLGRGNLNDRYYN